MQRAVLLIALLLAACAGPAPAPAPPSPTPLAFTPLDELLAGAAPGGEVTTLGYLLVDEAGARLVGYLSVAGDAPRPLEASDQIWCGGEAAEQIRGALVGAGPARYAIVAASGRLEGPGSFGPDGARYHMPSPTLTPIAPLETSIAALGDQPGAFERRVVRVVGGLLARPGSALLVDQLGPGGIPAPGARQVKLRVPDDPALLERLQASGGGAIRFGRVQIEGYWRGGALVPLAIVPIGG